MRADIKRFQSPDVDLDSYVPLDLRNVGVLVQIMVGPENVSGEESFDIVVCTPRWLETWVAEDGPLIGRHHLIVDRWDYARIRLYLTTLVEGVDAPSWEELASRLGRFAKWEFEDYVDPDN